MHRFSSAVGVVFVTAVALSSASAQQSNHSSTQGARSAAASRTAGSPDGSSAALAFAGAPKLGLAYGEPAPQSKGSTTKPAAKETKETKETKEVTHKEAHEADTDDYREVSDFFNIREANPSVRKNEWEFESEFGWATKSDRTDDDVFLEFSLKYGVTERMFVELEVESLNLGDGGDQGNGDLSLIVFYQWLKEHESGPAFATWAEMRIPSGEGSSGVDGALHFNLTKTLAPKFRGHFEGFIETANGGRGDEDDNRRAFQWGVGPGFDYQISDKTLVLVNYLNRSSEEYGHHNQNILEFGAAQQIAENQHLKAAVDIGLDGAEETPNFAVKLLWSIEW